MFQSCTYTSIILVATQCVVFLLTLMFWVVAAFRPDTIDPDLTRMLSDAGWLTFVWTWAPFSFFMGLVAVAIFNDKGVPAIFPRWIAWLCIWTALLMVPVETILLFKEGPFAWNGVISFWTALAIFFGWFVTMTLYMLKAIGEDE